MGAFPNKHDLYLFGTGEAQRAYYTYGCHYLEEEDMHRFCVWAPNAKAVSVVGDFNGWDKKALPMENTDGTWIAFARGLKDGDNYKYCVWGADGSVTMKADPFAFHSEVRPSNASKIWSLEGYEWHDEEYMAGRAEKNALKEPMSIYEMNLGSWRIKEGYKFPNIHELADELSEYLTDMGYTHVELMPVTEYPYDGSWGYQVTGWYAFTSRFGTPQEFMYFVDKMHEKGIGVILDWVGAHFPRDAHGLARFDGTELYEYSNPLLRDHPEWGTVVFDFGRPQVQSFLVSSAVFWMDKYHVDGLRMDAVSSMLYLDYARKEHLTNKYGGRENLEAIELLKKLNATILSLFPGAITVAEESTAFPMVTAPPYDGGLGFTFKWNMGYMHDTLEYFELDPIYRKSAHRKITFPMMYAFSENFILPYSHDEVVHGKLSMVNKMSGDYWQKFANLRALYGFMYAHPGKKLSFMGNEFAQFIEWNENQELDWLLLDYPNHAAMKEYVKELNHIYKENEALYTADCGWEGFKWLCVHGEDDSAAAFLRISEDGEKMIAAVFNFTPVVRYDYCLGLPEAGTLKLILNSDEEKFGGTGMACPEFIIAENEMGTDGLPYRAMMALPPLSAMYFEYCTGGECV